MAERNPSEPETLPSSPDEAAARRTEARDLLRRLEVSSPLPPPEILEHYERILPGSADRLLTMAEEQSRHRMARETRDQEADIRQTGIGMFLGFGIGLVCLVTAGWLGYVDQPWLGGVIGVGGITGLVGIFVWDRRSNPRS